MTDPSGILWGDALVAARVLFTNSATFQDYLDVESAAAAKSAVQLLLTKDPYADVPIIICPGESVTGYVHGDGYGSEQLGSGQLVATITLLPGDAVDDDDEQGLLVWFLSKAGAIVKEAVENSRNKALGGLVVNSWTTMDLAISDAAGIDACGGQWASCSIIFNYGNQ